MFVGLETALRAVQAHRAALNVREQNAANVSTPGYARRRINLRSVALSNLSMTSGKNSAVLSGVDACSIERMSDCFLDAETRRTAGLLARWKEIENILGGVESMIGGPSDPGVEDSFDALWASLQDLTLQPESMSTRAVVLQRAAAFCEAFRRTREYVSSSQQSLEDKIEVLVSRVNSLASEVAKLNGEIARATAAGRDAPSLLDRRDMLLDELAEVAGASVVQRKDGTACVLIGNGVLVSGESAGKIVANGLKVSWEKTGAEVKFKDGGLAGVLEGAGHLGSMVSKLDSIAAGLISAVNMVHRQGAGLDGTTGINFFAGNSAADISVSLALQNHPEKIAAAASADTLPGDASNALSMVRTMDTAPVFSGASFRDAYRSVISDLGTASADAKASLETARAVHDHSIRQRDQVRGVSLDEETVSMVEHQRAIEAAARFVTTVDEAMKAVLEMGVVGR